VIRIGTSGWVYKHWKGIFYPEKLPQRLWFEHYARHFDTVEINFTFYRLPELRAFESWHDRAPPGFTYAVKGSRLITHVRRLREPAEGVGRLLERLPALRETAGPVLWQLPPDFARDDERLEAFLAVLPRQWQHTLEFRHESWLVDPVFERLRQAGVALTIPDRPGMPRALELTADWTYVRFHAGATPDGNYTDAQLDEWARRIADWRDRGVAVWAYFNNDWYGFALHNAWGLMARLGVPQPLAHQRDVGEEGTSRFVA